MWNCGYLGEELLKVEIDSVLSARKKIKLLEVKV